MEKIINYLDKLFTRKDGKQDYCTASPDVICGVDIGFSSCKIHDEDYADKHMPRICADKKFKFNIQQSFNSDGKKIRGFFISWIYYLAVRIFGASHKVY